MRTFIRLSAVACAIAATAFLPATVLAQGFGAGVAVSGDQVLIGERGGPTSSGMVHVYGRAGGGWDIVSTVEPGDADVTGFGSALSVSGDRMIVGSSGAAYVYDRDGSGWARTGLLSAMPPEGLTFGSGVVIDGDRALVAAGGGGGRFGRGPAGPAGTVYVFELGDNGWTQTAELTSSAAASGDGFGSAMALRGPYAVIGAPRASAGNARLAGSVTLFNLQDDGSWVQVGDPLVAPDAAQGGSFGSAVYPHVTEDGATLFVGATGAAGGSGSVYSFNFDEGSWTPANRFFPPVVTVTRRRRFGGGGFGSSVTVVDNELWIGTGTQVLRYTQGDGGWMPATSLTGSTLEGNAGFGGRIAAGGELAVIAATAKDYGMGTAFIFEHGNDGWSESAEVWTEPTNYTAVTGGEVECDDGKASEFDCSDVDILSYVPVSQLGAARGVRTNDVWGWTDSQTGREYALIGMTDQASFIDVTDAANPRYLGRLMMTEGANGSTWRDIKVYKDHAFIVSDGAGDHGMQVFNLARLRDVGSSPVDFDMDAHYDGIASAHNIVINEDTGFAYSVGSSGGGETCGGGLHMIDIRTPTEPTFAGCFAHANTGRSGTGYSHDAMCIVYDGPDADYSGKEICFGSNETTVSIADVTDKDNTVAISLADYPRVGYAHQGWITEDHRYFYLGDELDEIQQAGGDDPFPGTRTMIWDVSDLDDPVFVGEYFGVSTASDHNMYIVGDLLYQSNYNSGLRILDISDPESPTEVGYLDTVPHAEGPAMGGSWSNYPYFTSGTIIVTSGSEGLFLLRHRKPELVP